MIDILKGKRNFLRQSPQPLDLPNLPEVPLLKPLKLPHLKPIQEPS